MFGVLWAAVRYYTTLLVHTATDRPYLILRCVLAVTRVARGREEHIIKLKTTTNNSVLLGRRPLPHTPSDSTSYVTVHAALHFKVDPAIMDKIFECVFVDEFFGDVGDFDADIFWLVRGGVEVEIFEIKGCKARPTLGEYIVDEEFDKLE